MEAARSDGSDGLTPSEDVMAAIVLGAQTKTAVETAAPHIEITRSCVCRNEYEQPNKQRSNRATSSKDDKRKRSQTERGRGTRRGNVPVTAQE